MAIQLHAFGQAGPSLDDKRWRTIACLSVVLTLLSLLFYSQSLTITVPQVQGAKNGLHSGHGVVDITQGRDRPLVVYVYADNPNARENLKFFLKRGIHTAADFIFIFNGFSDAPDLVPSHLTNVKVVQRENTCYDIGAVGEVLAKDNLWMKYKRFITMNASIRGPFVPVWSNECWTDTFFRKLTDEVKVCLLHERQGKGSKKEKREKKERKKKGNSFMSEIVLIRIAFSFIACGTHLQLPADATCAIHAVCHRPNWHVNIDRSQVGTFRHVRLDALRQL